MKSLMRRLAVCTGALAMLCAFALAFSAAPARSDSNITLTPADIARADSLRAAKKAANALRKRQEQELKQLQQQAAKEKANPNTTPSNVTEQMDSLAARMARSQGVPPSLNAKAPRVAKVKTPKAGKPAAAPSAEAKPAPVAVPVKPVVKQFVRKGPLPRTLTPLRRQTSDRAIAGDLDAIDAWQARLDSLPGAGADVWRAAGAKAWLNAAQVEYTDNDRQGFASAAFERGVALISEIEKGAAPVDSANAPKAVIPRGSVKVADSLYTRLESLSTILASAARANRWRSSKSNWRGWATSRSTRATAALRRTWRARMISPARRRSWWRNASRRRWRISRSRQCPSRPIPCAWCTSKCRPRKS